MKFGECEQCGENRWLSHSFYGWICRECEEAFEEHFEKPEDEKE